MSILDDLAKMLKPEPLPDLTPGRRIGIDGLLSIHDAVFKIELALLGVLDEDIEWLLLEPVETREDYLKHYGQRNKQ